MLTVLLWHVLNIDVKVLKNRDVDGALAARPEHRRGGHHRREVDCAPVARPVRVIISVMLTVLLRHVLYILLRHVLKVIISVMLTAARALLLLPALPPLSHPSFLFRGILGGCISR